MKIKQYTTYGDFRRPYVRNIEVYTPQFRKVIMAQDYLYNAAKEQVALWQTKIMILYNEFKMKFSHVPMHEINVISLVILLSIIHHNYGVYNTLYLRNTTLYLPMVLKNTSMVLTRSQIYKVNRCRDLINLSVLVKGC